MQPGRNVGVRICLEEAWGFCRPWQTLHAVDQQVAGQVENITGRGETRQWRWETGDVLHHPEELPPPGDAPAVMVGAESPASTPGCGLERAAQGPVPGLVGSTELGVWGAKALGRGCGDPTAIPAPLCVQEGSSQLPPRGSVGTSDRPCSLGVGSECGAGGELAVRLCSEGSNQGPGWV